MTELLRIRVCGVGVPNLVEVQANLGARQGTRADERRRDPKFQLPTYASICTSLLHHLSLGISHMYRTLVPFNKG